MCCVLYLLVSQGKTFFETPVTFSGHFERILMLKHCGLTTKGKKVRSDNAMRMYA
jgi:hypothetical protein